jgi:restriction system protein
MSHRNPSPGEILVQLPWWVSATLAGLVFVGLRWVLPGIQTENPLFRVFIPALANLAWLPAIGLGILAVFSAILAKQKRALVDEQTGLGSLRELSWKEFEWLVGEAYRRQGYAVEEFLGGGADGGVDLILRKNGATWFVQCKQWRTQAVGAPIIREIFGLVTHHQANGAIVITSGRFTREACAFAEGKTLELIDGPELLALVESVQVQPTTPPAAPTTIPAPTFSAPPVTAPGCPQCNEPMVRRTARKGSNAGNEFWGCSTYPKCRGVRNA